MGDMISILIVDDNAEFCDMMCAYFRTCKDLELKGIAKDGITAINMIEELSPDVVLLDVSMPNLNGIDVLETIPYLHLGKKPIFIMISAEGNAIFVKKAIECGADYFIMKPFAINILVNHIRQMFAERAATLRKKTRISIGKYGGNSEKKKDLEQVVTDLIIKLGITPNITGYRYLREAVMMLVEEPTFQISIGRCVFQKIAEKHNTEQRNVDRAIRCALDNAFKKMFSNCADGDLSMPDEFNSRKKRTNSSVIIHMAEKSREEMGLKS